MQASMAKSSRLYVLGLGNMLFAGCKADALNSSVFNFAHTQVLIDDLNKVVSSEILHLDASCPALGLNLNFSKAEAVFFEINTPDATHESLDILKKVRQTNQAACVFILVTHSKSFSGTHFYVSGADHCLKLPNDPQERKQLLSKTIKESHWESTAQLYLDRTRLLLCSTTHKLDISYTEMTIIDALIKAPEHVMSQDRIAKTLDPNIIFYDPRALEKTISRLRTKIRKTYNIELIISVRAYGYRLRRGTISR
ncbi:winged helix-turn-helix domain-containing protein [Pseudomonas sp.]|uniref:winged helix-turn-helix domain-containing protein n=1 Tax=Pseudomonas sp. TaxID=306 RepID=UPI002354183A|nr:winged helix-turn-helix domain-containing protein [Pseudomonas sp.]